MGLGSDTTRGKWIVVVQGKVGVALGPGMTEKWRQAGAKIHFPGKDEDPNNRIVAVEIDSKDREEGLFLVSAYAPVSTKSAEKEHER